MTSSSPGDWRSSFGYGPGQQAGSLRAHQTFADQQKAGHATLKDIQFRQEVEAKKQREHEANLASNCKTM